MRGMNDAQGRMRIGERRALSAGEIALGRSLFDEHEIAWARVRVAQAPALGFGAMVPLGRTIIFSRWRAARDFASASIEEQGWFAHELMHVWQAARGTVLAGAKLRALGKRAYDYKPKLGLKLAHYNIERQAEIARHLFLARAGAPEPAAPDLAWLEAIWATRSKRWFPNGKNERV
jgi:hypothetical protein